MLAQFSVLALDALLAATFVYLVVLMRKLKSFHKHRDEMRTIVSDVITATESAREAVARLKSSVLDSQASMAQYFEDARQIENRIETQIADAKLTLREFETRKPAMASARPDMQHTLSQQRPDADRRDELERSVRSQSLTAALVQREQQQQAAASHKPRSEADETDLNRRLASLSESVNSLRSKIVTYS